MQKACHDIGSSGRRRRTCSAIEMADQVLSRPDIRLDTIADMTLLWTTQLVVCGHED